DAANNHVLVLVAKALHLDQEWPGALEGGHYDRARCGRRRGREEGGRRIRHLLETALAHGEHADLLGRAEAVLGGAQQAELLPAVAFQVQHGVNDMLQDPRSGNGTFFGDVPDQEDGNADLLGQPHESGSRLPNLGDAAGAALEAGVRDGLDRVDDRQTRTLRLDRLADRVEVV